MYAAPPRQRRHSIGKQIYTDVNGQNITVAYVYLGTFGFFILDSIILCLLGRYISGDQGAMHPACPWPWLLPGSPVPPVHAFPIVNNGQRKYTEKKGFGYLAPSSPCSSHSIFTPVTTLFRFLIVYSVSNINPLYSLVYPLEPIIPSCLHRPQCLRFLVHLNLPVLFLLANSSSSCGLSCTPVSRRSCFPRRPLLRLRIQPP